MRRFNVPLTSSTGEYVFPLLTPVLVTPVLYLLSSNSCPLPPVLYLLFSTSCSLPPVLYLLPSISCSLPPVLYLLFSTSCSLPPVLYLLFSTSCPLTPVLYLLFSTSCSLLDTEVIQKTIVSGLFPNAAYFHHSGQYKTIRDINNSNTFKIVSNLVKNKYVTQQFRTIIGKNRSATKYLVQPTLFPRKIVELIVLFFKKLIVS